MLVEQSMALARGRRDWRYPYLRVVGYRLLRQRFDIGVLSGLDMPRGPSSRPLDSKYDTSAIPP